MYKRILVGVDFSEASRKALAEASVWAKTLGVPATALHVLHPPALKYDKQWEADTEAHAKAQLQTWLESYPEMTGKVVWGDAAVQMVSAAGSETLIVVGSLGHSALEHLLFGSTAAKVVSHAPGNVLVVRAPGKL